MLGSGRKESRMPRLRHTVEQMSVDGGGWKQRALHLVILPMPGICNATRVCEGCNRTGRARSVWRVWRGGRRRVRG